MRTKKEIRRELINNRESMSKELWREKSAVIQEKVLSLPEFQNCEYLFCYMQAKNEVDTAAILEAGWKMGKKVYVPKVFGDEMEFFRVYSFEDLETGTFGIREPKDESVSGAEIEEAVMIVPGVGFDRTGNRIGYGKGYYDKYLSRHPKFYTAGIAFELQIVEEVPAEPTDYRLNMIISEVK